MRSCWGIWAGLLIISGAIAGRGQTSSEVFRVDTTLYGVIQNGVISNSTISKVQIRAEDLVNLAQGIVLGTPVPQNQILAFANHCLTDLRLIVYDTTTASNIVTIGDAVNLSTAFSSRKKYEETIHQFTINNTTPGGQGSNGIVGGSFFYHGKINIDTNYCPKSFGGQFVGVLRTAFPFIATNIFCTNFVDSVTLKNCVTNCVTTNEIVCTTNVPPDCTTNLITNCDVNCKTNIQSHSDCWTNIFPSVELIDVIVPRSSISTSRRIGYLQDP